MYNYYKTWNLICSFQIHFPDSARSPEIYSLLKGIGKYKLHTEHKTFDDALITCANEGGILAILETYPEASILKYMYEEFTNATGDNTTSFFVGCEDRDEEGLFVTVKGKSIKGKKM